MNRSFEMSSVWSSLGRSESNGCHGSMMPCLLRQNSCCRIISQHLVNEVQGLHLMEIVKFFLPQRHPQNNEGIKRFLRHQSSLRSHHRSRWLSEPKRYAATSTRSKQKRCQMHSFLNIKWQKKSANPTTEFRYGLDWLRKSNNLCRHVELLSVPKLMGGRCVWFSLG